MAYRLALSAAALRSAASAQIMGDDTMMPDDDTPHNSGSKWSMDYEAMGGTVSTAVIDIDPGYEGEFSIGGWVTVADLGEQQGCIDCTGPTGGLVLKAGLFGLESSAIGGLHVHAGTNCDSPDGPGEHYVQDGQEDIWNDGMQWESDGNGDATVYHELSEYTLPTSGRAVVIHLSDGTRAGCGVRKGAASATIGTYPGYTGMQYVGGTVVVSEWDCGIDVDAELTGLEPNAEGGMRLIAMFVSSAHKERTLEALGDPQCPPAPPALTALTGPAGARGPGPAAQPHAARHPQHGGHGRSPHLRPCSRQRGA